MKQICCLADGKLSELLEPLLDQLDIIPYPREIENVKSLVAFVNRERTLHQMDYILFDLRESTYSQEHILSAVQLLRRFSVADLIFLAPAGEETDRLFGKLANFHLENLIAVDAHTDLPAELMACFQEDGGSYHRRLSAMGMGMAAEARSKASPLRIPPGLVVTVAVAGAQTRIGTTTQCFALYHYLKGVGFRPALLDGGEGTLDVLIRFCEDYVDQQEGYTRIRGIPFCTEMQTDFNAYIMDLGTLRPELMDLFSGADMSILVGGTKPWELPHLAGALKLLGGRPCRLATLVSFSTQQDMDEIGQYLGENTANVPYHPDIWEPGSTRAYQTVLLPLLKKICGGGEECPSA